MRMRLTAALVLVGFLATPMSAASAATPPTTGRRTYDVPSSIDPTGATDVTAALTSFIQHVPDHSLIRFPSKARYRIESIVLVGNRHDLVIEGNNSTFFATTTGQGQTPIGPAGVRGHWPRHRSQWIVYDSTNIDVRDIAIVGANKKGGVADATCTSGRSKRRRGSSSTTPMTRR